MSDSPMTDSVGAAWSYVHGASSTPLMGETIGAFFDQAAKRWRDREALVVRHQNIRWTYGELQRRVDELACGLLALGFQPGERIGIWSQNCAEWTVTQFATAKAGLVLVNINPAYRRAELEYALNKVGCKGLILAPSFKTSNYIEMLGDLAPELAGAKPGAPGAPDVTRRAATPPGDLRAAKLPELRHLIRLGTEKTPGMYNFDDVCRLGSNRERQRLDELAGLLQFDDPINIQFTSGTTGFPKGATLTHHNILNNAFFCGEAMRFTEADRLCIPVPLYHCFGMVLGNLVCLTHGSAMIYPGEAFDPKAVLEAVQAERCTALHGVPTMFIAVLDHPDFKKYDVASLRTGIMAGAPCPVAVMRRVIDEMHMREITIAYGMTEMSPVSFQSAATDSLERRVSTVGRIQPHVECKIVDTEGRIVPRGERGEIVSRGYSVMRGYWGDEAKTRESIDAGRWMHTGDLGTIDAEGYCNIVGRLKDMVIRGGENVYPREIEEFLFRHPKVQDVQVFGVPDAKYGEEICAWIKLREGQQATDEEIRAFCKGQIAHYKIPRYVRFVTEFPMTVTGKAQKFIMRERMVSELGVKEQKTA